MTSLRFLSFLLSVGAPARSGPAWEALAFAAALAELAASLAIAAALLPALVTLRLDAVVSVLGFLAMVADPDAAASFSFFSLRLVLPDGFGDLRLAEAGDARCLAWDFEMALAGPPDTL